jgi:hypothetical protein
MAWVAINCPQCSAPLPRVAIWRSVKCPSCGALIVRNESLVTREPFRQALARARQAAGVLSADVVCGGQGYALMETLGQSEHSHVYLARGLGLIPFLVTMKLSSAPAAIDRYAREAQVLRELQQVDAAGAGAFFSQRLPEVVAQGVVEGDSGRHALVLRYPHGYWGSLAALSQVHPGGLDPRHGVWIWRRMLEMLGFLHGQGWVHGDVRPEHALVHPEDHGVRLIGWAAARRGASAHEYARDLARSARVILVLLSGEEGAGSMPGQMHAGLAQLITRASQDEDFCRAQGAHGIDTLLRAAAREAFGPPAFIPLTV